MFEDRSVLEGCKSLSRERSVGVGLERELVSVRSVRIA